ncbi:MAG: carbohydrate kinase family protein [Clostridiales bacterium]|jgi:sugar/nucleoside kinase (ribokinase family)|nr:carbohydrate kinase family protein [Clostridiales bacterium]
MSIVEASKTELHSQLSAKKDVKLNMIVGVDGFVDEIIHVVAQRKDFKSFTRIMNIEEFGNRIVRAAGLSTNIELVTAQTKLGGNGPILANALLEYGADLSYIGAVGSPDIHPVFKPMSDKAANVYSLCEPGHTDALEFMDGKLMLGKHAGLDAITWDRFKEVLGGLEKTADTLSKADLLALVNWTMIPNMSDIWQSIIDEVFPLLPDRKEKPAIFFDLADPEKRTIEDIRHAMDLISKFEPKFKSILGLNKKELYEIAAVYGVAAETFEDTLKYTYEKLGIYCLVVHPTKDAACCANGEYFHVDGPYCEKPVLTTGAGDNFNAGFCLGQALGISPLNSLLLGVSTSGFYVRNAKSPSIDDLLKFLIDWESGKL